MSRKRPSVGGGVRWGAPVEQILFSPFFFGGPGLLSLCRLVLQRHRIDLEQKWCPVQGSNL